MLINLNQDDVDQKNSKLYDVAIIGAGACRDNFSFTFGTQ